MFTIVLAAHAIAAPEIPRCGISSRFKKMFVPSDASVFHRLSELLPPMSSTMSTGPNAMLTSMAPDMITIAGAPAPYPFPNRRRTPGANAMSSR